MNNEIVFATFSPDERTAVTTIIDRVTEIIPGVDRLSLHMDLAAVHRSTPLDLQRLSEASVIHLVHDVTGIVSHLDRDTGKLQDCFLPRHVSRSALDCLDCPDFQSCDVDRAGRCQRES
jgi:hypothetical protein